MRFAAFEFALAGFGLANAVHSARDGLAWLVLLWMVLVIAAGSAGIYMMRKSD